MISLEKGELLELRYNCIFVNYTVLKNYLYNPLNPLKKVKQESLPFSKGDLEGFYNR